MTGFVVLGHKCQNSLLSANCYITDILCIIYNLIPCSGSQLVGCNPSFYLEWWKQS